MVNNKSISTTITVTAVPESHKIYRTTVDNKLYVYNDFGELLEPYIDILFFTDRFWNGLFRDSSNDIYCLNTNNRISKYNFTSKELDEVPGQTGNWTEIDGPWTADTSYPRVHNLGMLDDGSIMISAEYEISSVKYVKTFRYSIDGTKLEEADFTQYHNGVLQRYIYPVSHFFDDASGLTALSTDSRWGSNPIGAMTGIGTYSSTGLLTRFDRGCGAEDSSAISGASIYYNRLLFTNSNFGSPSNKLSYAYLDTCTFSHSIDMSEFTKGIIVKVAIDTPQTFNGVLESIESVNDSKSTIPDDTGQPVLFTEKGRKFLEITTDENLDYFLKGEVHQVFVDGEEFYLESIRCRGDTYEVTLQTPEKV